MSTKRNAMLETNFAQREYYEKADGYNESPLNSRATNIWRRMRRNAYSVFKNAEIQKSVVQLHGQWIGDVSNAKVLDLGPGQGNPLSLTLAREAREYVAIDLSSTRMEIFRTKLSDAGIQGAKTYVADFLSDDFPETGFDIVYAMSVFHHFEHIEVFLEALSDRMSAGAVGITQDPLQTWLPMKLVRLVYHRLQTGGAWEFPFTRDSLEIIQRKFKVEQVQGIYGYSKWAIPISILSPEMAKHYAQRWHRKDLRYATRLNSVTSCLRICFMLRKQ